MFPSHITVFVYSFNIDPGTNRYSLGFTVRDSPTDYVNVTCWGSGSFIKDVAQSFKINDIGMTIDISVTTLLRRSC